MKLGTVPIPQPPNPFGFSIEACDATIVLHYPDMRAMVHEWRRVRHDAELLAVAASNSTPAAVAESAELLLNQRILAFEFARLEQPSELLEEQTGSRRGRMQFQAALRDHCRDAHDASALRTAIKADPRFRGEPAIFHMVPGYDGEFHDRSAEMTSIMAYASNGWIIQI